MIIAVLQARMSSTRLPGKVLRPLAGAPMIVRQIERIRRCRRIDDIILATSTDAGDTPLAHIAQAVGVSVHRGPLDDVLGRYLGALHAHPADHVVRLTGDCPLADPDVIDAVIDLHLQAGGDYASNTPAHRTYPKGLDVEVMRSDALRRAGMEGHDPYEREHVTPYLYRHPELFALHYLSQAAEEGEARWTVDRPDDLEFVQTVYEALYTTAPAFTSDDVRNLIRRRPDLQAFGGDPRL
jgi:spore coat polysaccharide biosynthesis protein SpsF